MTNQTPNHLSLDRQRVVSAQTLANLFNVAAEEILKTGKGQRLGSYVVTFASSAGIKQHRTRGRVTYVELITASDAAGSVVTHEVHFPSKDKQVDDFEADRAIFETHQYDKTGNRISTERTVLDQIDMAGPEIQPFVEQIGGLKP